MFLAKKLTSKMTYFLRSNPEVEIPYFTFYVINHTAYDQLLQYLKQKKDNLFGKMLINMLFK